MSLFYWKGFICLRKMTCSGQKSLSFICCIWVLFFSVDCYSLSVLRKTNSSCLDGVKHYRISQLQNGWVYISPGLTFPSLHHLVEHYSGLYRGCQKPFPHLNPSLSQKSSNVKKKPKNNNLLLQSQQMDCRAGSQRLASSWVQKTLQRTGRYPQLSGGPPSTGRTSAGVADSLQLCFSSNNDNHMSMSVILVWSICESSSWPAG